MKVRARHRAALCAASILVASGIALAQTSPKVPARAPAQAAPANTAASTQTAAAQPSMETIAEKKDNLAGPYVPTPWEIVTEMLRMADIGPNDVVYDLGSGDGRLVITAAKRYGARGTGFELQDKLVDMARKQAAEDGVAERTKFVQADLFETDLSAASVVTLYLLPRFTQRLVPKLRAELKPGSRIVSHDYPLSPWPADKVLSFDVPEKEMISGTTRTVLHYYVVPARVGGTWELRLPPELGLPAGATMSFTQTPEAVDARAALPGEPAQAVRDLSVRGERVRFALFAPRGRNAVFEGTVSDRQMAGEVVTPAGKRPWSATLK